MDDTAELLMALDRTEEAGAPPHLVERLRGLVRASRPVRVEADPEVWRLFPELCSFVEDWAADPTPKLPGLRVDLTIDVGVGSLSVPLSILLEMSWSYEGEAYRLTRMLSEMALSRGHYPRSQVVSTLDVMHQEIISAIRSRPAWLRGRPESE